MHKVLFRRCHISTSTAGEQLKAPQSVEWFELHREVTERKCISWFAAVSCPWRTANSLVCYKLFNLILSLGYLGMDPGLSTIFCLVRICAFSHCQVLWPPDVGCWKLELRQSCNRLLPKAFCHPYRYPLHICCSWVSPNVLILGTVNSPSYVDFFCSHNK